MKGKLLNFVLLFFLLPFCMYAQRQNSPADKYFEFLNNYQVDSLENLLSDNFQLKRTFADFTNDKSSFLNTYIKDSKELNAKFKITRTISGNEPKQFLVEDESDALKYLDIVRPTWKITVKARGYQVEQVIIDTTESYQNYLEDITFKETAFWSWIKQSHPHETEEVLYEDKELLSKRLKEYSLKRK